MPQPHANLSALVTYQHSTSERFEGLHAGGTASLQAPDLQLHHAAIAQNNQGIIITATGPTASLESVLPLLGLPTTWKPYAALEAHLANGPAPLTVTLAVLGPRCQLSASLSLAPHQSATLSLDLTDLPLTAGIRPLYDPNALRLTLTPTPGNQSPETETHLTLHALTLTPRATPSNPVVDSFGQRLSTTWPNKILSLDDLRTRAAAEPALLASQFPPPPDRDPFGGWNHPDAPAFTPTGFFHVAQDRAGRWWFVTPAGHPFWSVGTTGIRTTDCTPVTHREHLFAALPARDGPHASAYMPHGFSFYRWNLLRKYPSLDAWRDRVLARFHHLGLNTIACWSEDLMLRQQQIPHVRFFRARADQLPGQHRFPDVFDLAWQSLVDTFAAEHLAPHRDDPWLLGIFVDNEAPWRDMRLLTAPGTAPLRDAWLGFLRQRYTAIESLNAAWQTLFRTWLDVRNLSDSQFPATRAAAEDMTAFEALYADRYFSVIRHAVKKHAPNHLYLGCRFVRIPPHPAIVAAAGRHVDVLSVNCYALTPDRAAFTAWHNMAGGKPILIGEHHLALDSPRQLPPLYRNFTAEERRRYYQQFVHDWASMPFSLGCHWFQHADQPLTGRFQDGEDQTIGLVDITDQPHDDLATAFHASTAQMYPWHNHA